MSLRRRVVTVICFTIAAIAASVLTAGAQTPARPGDAPAAPKPPASAAKPGELKRKYDPARRVPPYFGQIGLNINQRESIYKIRSKHQAKIDELEKQIATAQAGMLSECEGVLTETQKKLLENLRTASPSQGATATADAKAPGSK